MKFASFSGILTTIDNFVTGDQKTSGCLKLMTVVNQQGSIVNFVVTPTTYFVDNVMLTVGDFVTGYYDSTAFVPLIYPPQYQALVMTKITPYQNVKVDFFNSQFLSSDRTLKLNITPFTQIILENDQAFTSNPANHYLIVVYGATTRSIPAQTTPFKIIVLCR